MKPTDFAYHLSRYFTTYMPGVLGLSSKTIGSYQDAFYVFLRYCKMKKKIEPEKITLKMLDLELVTDFLQSLEEDGNSISTRNHRLTALRSFFKYIQLVEPKYIYLMQQLLAIKHKKCKKASVNYLTVDGIKLLLKQPDSSSRTGYRDLLILSILYESGSRVDELINIKVGDIRLDNPATILLHGKGNKSRIVPISQEMAKLIKTYLRNEKLESFERSSRLLFLNRSGNKLTGAGIAYIIKKYANAARSINPSIIPSTLSPHCIRHSKAMHLLQAGVDLIYIRDFLGHESIKTTEIYAKVDSSAKRKALENAYKTLPLNADDLSLQGDWHDSSNLMDWLRATCR
jgi:site-specific recombinase XerD